MDSCMFDSPIGRLYIETDGRGICAVGKACGEEFVSDRNGSELLGEAVRQLSAYFRGVRMSFDVPFSLRGTPFEKRVWERLCAIPYGQVRTYGQIADELGCPGASRAVGRACGANPVLVIVPCHRVIGAGGKLTGFAAGMDAKRALLSLEGHGIYNDRVREKR